ncbi:MAG: hypothetical protein NTV34_14905 [Proteobacteria bacterium]|nr:hypothetical protein [Pseudomonadota bacterium]
MNELSLVTILIGVTVLIAVLLPFFLGEGGLLLDAAKNDSIENLEKKQKIILERWLADEAAATSGLITTREWAMRERYLTNRYVGTTRRIDWLKNQERTS